MRRWAEAALKLAGWFALAYLGYWAALLVDRVLVPLVAFPLAGAPINGWTVTPFRAVIQTGEPEGSSAVATFLSVLPLLLQVLFLIVLTSFGGRIRSASARIALHFAGLWTVLLLASQVALLAYLGRGALARLLAPAASGAPLSLTRRIAWAAIASLLLLGAGRMSTGRLLADLRTVWARKRQTWLAPLGLIVPVLVILLGAFNFFSAIHFLGLRALFYLLVPAAACLVLALLGLTWRAAHGERAALSRTGAAIALCVFALLYAGLGQAPRVHAWRAEHHLESVSSAHYQVSYDPKLYSRDRIRGFITERERILAAEAARIEMPLDAAPGWGEPTEMRLRVVLYPDPDSLRAVTSNDQPYGVNGTTIRAMLGDYVQHVDPAADAAALLSAAWGRPGTERLGEWVTRWVAGQWRGRAVNDWAGQIEHEVGHYTLAQLANASSDGLLSPLVRQPLGAAWVGTVFDRWGLGAVHKLYAAKLGEPGSAAMAEQLGVTAATLEQDWQQWIASAASRVADDPPRRALDADFFFRGISFSHEGWSGRGGGYISPEASAELRRLKTLGANAIAVVPYGFVRGPHEETLFYTSTDETDEQLTHALHVAHGLGMKVMLKPQLWVTRGEFTGTIRFDDPKVRSGWMRNYREFILHYARLAELEQFDLLSIGNELEGLTAYPDDWRRLIAEVRRVYHGPLTYAANWGHEFETISFWDALDCAGVNNYYPLGVKPASRVEELWPGAERLAERLEALSRKWHKSILFTEVGYPSVRGGSSEPWIEDAGRGASVEEQAAAYEATFRAFAGRRWLCGMFWWKWPSSGRGGGPHDASYTPMGKPAEEVLRAWFTRLAGAPKPPSTQAR